MIVPMTSFYFHSDLEICEILKYYKIKYEENGFIIKTVDMNVPPEFSKPDVDYVCGTTYIYPFKIQCNSCFTILKEKSIFCDIVFAYVQNEKGVKMSSLVNSFSKNDRILVLNASFSKIFGVEHLFILPHKKNLSIFHFKYNERPLFPYRIDDIYFKLTDTNIYSLFGRVIEIKKKIDEDKMHLMIQCYGYQNNPLYVYKPNNFSQDDIMCMVKCNCFPELIDVMVNEPNTDFNLLTPDQQIQLNNVKANYLRSLNMYSLYVKGEPENLSFISKNITLPDKDQNTIPKKLNSMTFSKADESQESNTSTHFQALCDSNETFPETLSEAEQKEVECNTSQLSQKKAKYV